MGVVVDHELALVIDGRNIIRGKWRSAFLRLRSKHPWFVVLLLMSVPIAFLGEAGFAVPALVWLLPRVRSQMHLQLGDVLRLLYAIRALKLVF